ncbi:MAG: thiosulfate oxidation carrier protein SoxY [Geminicoccaceae bacterium]|jgi:sulfur-oxidizing protein SoxY|nr:MAG: thiosulfate oxidation carrier protein SoxY [Geminicoccaceae bacterium]
MRERSAASRRRVIQGAGALALGGLWLAGRPAEADLPKLQKLLAELTGGKTPQEGKVRLDMPEIAENGQTVPLTASVDSPMTANDYCKVIHILAEGNPEAGVCSFKFTPASGRAEFSTRMRLAQTQNVWAVAEMSDGSVWMTKTEVKVTIGGCGG